MDEVLPGEVLTSCRKLRDLGGATRRAEARSAHRLVFPSCPYSHSDSYHKYIVHPQPCESWDRRRAFREHRRRSCKRPLSRALSSRLRSPRKPCGVATSRFRAPTIPWKASRRPVTTLRRRRLRPHTWRASSVRWGDRKAEGRGLRGRTQRSSALPERSSALPFRTPTSSHLLCRRARLRPKRLPRLAPAVLRAGEARRYQHLHGRLPR